jgi:hypothetical protein
MKWVPAMAFVQHMLVGMCIAAAPASVAGAILGQEFSSKEKRLRSRSF